MYQAYSFKQNEIEAMNDCISRITKELELNGFSFLEKSHYRVPNGVTCQSVYLKDKERPIVLEQLQFHGSDLVEIFTSPGK